MGKKFCAELKTMKLLYYDPKSAIKFVNNLKTIKIGGLKEENQKKLLKLKNSYAFTSKNHINDWYKNLIN